MDKKIFISILAGLIVAFMLLGLIVGILPHNAGAVTSNELKDQLNALQEEKDAITAKIKDLEQQQSANRADIDAIMQQKAVIEQQIALLQDEITNVNEQIAAYSLLIADKQDELEEAESHLAYLTDMHKKRLRAMEEQGPLSYWSVIFKANSFSDLLDRVIMVKEIAAADQQRLTEMNEAATAVLETQKELEAEKHKAKALKERQIPGVSRIAKNGAATIVFWDDGTKTVVKRAEDEPESDYAAFTAALGIKCYGSNSAVKRIVGRTETQKRKKKKQENDALADAISKIKQALMDGMK